MAETVWQNGRRFGQKPHRQGRQIAKEGEQLYRQGRQGKLHIGNPSSSTGPTAATNIDLAGTSRAKEKPEVRHAWHTEALPESIVPETWLAWRCLRALPFDDLSSASLASLALRLFRSFADSRPSR